MLLVIDADGDDLGINLVKVGLPLRELAQLLEAEGSPVPTIEVEHDFVALC